MGADPAAEEQFGPYLVYERLGVGGMATVHRALEVGSARGHSIEGFERVVALKRLLPHLAEDASFIKSFVREAKLASLLNHHNIVQIYELGRVGTEYFISMEYIDGRDIRRILRHARKVSGPPPIHVTVGILLQLAEALDYAHTKTDEDGHPLGLVHRDISPSNLIVTPAGHLKVIDFGIARAQSAQLRTHTGRVKGKMAYMAPEAISSAKDLDARSDLWAVGVIAHELLTARPLFARKNEYETLLKVQRGDIARPSTFNEGCPPELDAIVMKLLARDPDERFLDAAALREALAELRRALKLATGTRDIATWLTWAFSLEAPGGFAQNTGDRSGSGAFDLSAAARSLAGVPVASPHATPTPRPHRDDDEAVEIAWGGGDEAVAGQPLELDDVPDVSTKHVAPRAADPDFDHGDDDIPRSEPTHGVIRLKRDTDRSAPIALPLPPPPTTPAPERRRPTSKGMVAGGRARPDTLDVPSNPEHAPTTARALSEISTALDHSAPVVRDTQPSVPPMPARSLDQIVTDDDRHDDVVATAPRRVRSSTTRAGRAEDAAPRAARSSTPPITIGNAIVARESVRSRAWIGVLGLVVVGGGAAAYVVLGRGDGDPPPPASVEAPAIARARSDEATRDQAPAKGTLKFVIEPADVAISITGVAQHQGSPWSIEVTPGQHNIELRRPGFKPRVTTIELSPNETQTLLVNLEKAPRRVGAGMSQQATLMLDSDPPGLDVVIDGRVISERTPVTRLIPVGKHDIALRQNGVEVWRHRLIAEAEVDHAFRPVFTEQKKRERRQRVAGVPAERTLASHEPTTEPVAEPTPEPPPTTRSAIAAPISVAPPPELPPAPPPAPLPVPNRQPVQPPPSSGPITVAPNAVRRVAGDTPTLGASKPAQMPPVVSAKVCIDPQGAVAMVEILTKLERHTTMDLAATIKGWRYAPYKQPDGTAVPACFSVNFRVK